jgi:anaerobic ribonucleoside-triphosphate reductase
MGYTRNKRKGLLLAWQMTAAELMWQGKTNKEIIEILWPNAQTKGQKEAKQKQLKKLPDNEDFMEYYRKMINHWNIQSVGPAFQKLRTQLDSDKEWLANKAANDIINQSKQIITGADDNTVVIKMEGMPELGCPDDDNG